MANAIIQLVVPGIDNTEGPATDVSTLDKTKSVEISGAYQGSYTVLGSQDGTLYVPLLIFDSGAGAQAFKQTTNVIVRFMRVKRNATAITSMSVAGETTTSNQFVALAPVQPNTQTGPLPSVDLWTLVPTTGYDFGFAALGAGDFIGTIALEGSLDGTQFSPLGAFYASPRDPNAASPHFSPIIVTDTVRYVRLNIMPGTYVSGPVFVTIGGNQVTTGAPFPGFGGPPPPVEAASVTGVAATVSHSDHTHEGVHSVNSEVGDVVIESTDGSIDVSEPDADHVDLSVTDLGRGTLASIYAFGLSDDPTTDNLFGMPSGNLRFPGTYPFDGHSYDVGFFGGLTLDTYSSGSAYNYVRKAADLGLGTTGVTFNDYCLNDTAWNTNPATISGANWIIEQITLNNATTDDRAGFATYAERRYLFSSTGAPISLPGGFGTNYGVLHSLYLWNSVYGFTETVRTNDFGQTLSLVMSDVDAAVTPAYVAYYYPRGNGTAGGGTGFIIDAAVATAPYGHDQTRVGFLGKLATNDWLHGEWYGVIGAWNPLASDEHVLPEVAQFWSTAGEKLVVGGLQLPNEDSSTFAVGDANTIRIIWDDTLKKLMGSIDTAPYVPLFTSTVMTYNWSLMTNLTTGTEDGSSNLTSIWIPGNPGNINVSAGIYGGTGTDVAHYVSSTPNVYRSGTFYVFEAGNQGTSARLDTAYVEVVAAIPLVFATNMEYVTQLWKTTDITNAASYTLLASGNIDITGAGGLTDNQVTLVATGPANPTINNGDRLFLAVFRSDKGASTLLELFITVSARFIPVP